METIKYIVLIVVISLASVNLLLARFALLRLHQPTSLALWATKVFVSALSPILFVIGILFAVSGLLLNSIPATILGSLSALFYLMHISRITQPPNPATGFEKAFGGKWENLIPQERKNNFFRNAMCYTSRILLTPSLSKTFHSIQFRQQTG